MKKILILAIALLFLSILAHTASAAPAREAKTIPMTFRIQGTLQSNETYIINFPLRSVKGSGSGQATQLGGFTLRYEGQVNLLDLSGVSSVHFVAANGESLYATATGQALENGILNVYNVFEIYKITGGTGSLTNASGTITVQRVWNNTQAISPARLKGLS
jgi:hypothetical protein